MAATHTQSTYTISDLAREFDLTTRAIRFYEDMGLLQPTRSGPGGRNRVSSHGQTRHSRHCRDRPRSTAAARDRRPFAHLALAVASSDNAT